MRHCVRWGPRSPPKGGHSTSNFGPCVVAKRHTSPPQFTAHVCSGQNGWMDQDATWYGGRPRPLHIVLDGVPHRGTAPAPMFGPCLLWPNGWMDQDTIWYGGKPWPSRHCVKWGSSSSGKGTAPPTFRSMSIVAKWLDG